MKELHLGRLKHWPERQASNLIHMSKNLLEHSLGTPSLHPPSASQQVPSLFFPFLVGAIFPHMLCLTPGIGHHICTLPQPCSSQWVPPFLFFFFFWWVPSLCSPSASLQPAGNMFSLSLCHAPGHQYLSEVSFIYFWSPDFCSYSQGAIP